MSRRGQARKRLVYKWDKAIAWAVQGLRSHNSDQPGGSGFRVSTLTHLGFRVQVYSVKS